MSTEIETLHRPFSKFLREQGAEFINARSDKASTIEVGLPDFVLLSPTSAPLFIEFKGVKTPTTARQKEVHERLKQRGFKVHIVRELSIAIELVNAWKTTSPLAVLVGECASIHVADLGKGRGDWVCDKQGIPIRRATISDVSTMPRK